MDYNATLTITPSSPVEDDEVVDVLMEAFADYHPAVGDAPASPGALQAVVTVPAHTLAQAVATATALAARSATWRASRSSPPRYGTAAPASRSTTSSSSASPRPPPSSA